MSLYKEWNELTKREMTPEQSDEFWKDYFLKEKRVYEQILANKDFVIECTLKEFAEKYGLEDVFTIAFIDGINTSIKDQIEIESLEIESVIKLDIDKEKLYYNMHVAGADWLYKLPEWDDNLSAEKREEIEKKYKVSKTFIKEATIGRNDPCTCGSGKKFKKCCGK